AYRGYFTREQLSYSLSIADVHLISLRREFVGISVPGKLYGIMASARPALFVGPLTCESAETIVQCQCGFVIDPQAGNPETRLVEALRMWERDPDLAKMLAGNGRHAFIGRYEREGNRRLFASIVASAWDARRASQARAGVPD